ncbi:MAG: acyl-CoA thioesterase [Polyangiaceae bacterium]|nr:acyl-CoA thioesterase [Polyangiaceae bacterium]
MATSPDVQERGNTTFEYRLKINESHLDTFGHVNNAKYLELFEESRWEMITERGFGLDMIRATGLGPVILRADVKFRRELKNRESVVIRTQLENYEGLVGKLRQQLFKEDGQLSADALFDIAMWDTKSRKLQKPSDDFLFSILGARPPA